MALDLCQSQYQFLLISYLKFTKNNSKYFKKKENIKSVSNFTGLKNNKLNYECKEY